MISDTFRYKRGANQQFCQMSHVFDPTQFSDDELLYDTERKVIPVAIHCVAEKGPEGKCGNVVRFIFFMLTFNFVKFLFRYASISYDDCYY